MDATTGKALGGAAHLAQSVADVLGTPLGSLVMRRDYGSLLFELIDQPVTPVTAMLIRAACAIALRIWGPEIGLGKVTGIAITGVATEGNLTASIRYRPTGTAAANAASTLSIPLPATMGGKRSS